jgi:hypothetical protein
MSALGQKQTLQHVRVMSALPPKADIGTQSRNAKSGHEAILQPKRLEDVEEVHEFISTQQ